MSGFDSLTIHRKPVTRLVVGMVAGISILATSAAPAHASVLGSGAYTAAKVFGYGAGGIAVLNQKVNQTTAKAASQATKFGTHIVNAGENYLYNSRQYTLDPSKLATNTKTHTSSQVASNLSQYLTKSDLKKLYASGAVFRVANRVQKNGKTSVEQSFLKKAGFANYQSKVHEIQNLTGKDIAFMKHVTYGYYVNPAIYKAIESGQIKYMSESQIRAIVKAHPTAHNQISKAWALTTGQAHYIGSTTQNTFGGFAPPPSWLKQNTRLQIGASSPQDSKFGAEIGYTVGTSIHQVTGQDPLAGLFGGLLGSIVGTQDQFGFNPFNNLDKSYAKVATNGTVTIDMLGLAALFGHITQPKNMVCSEKPILKVGVGWAHFHWGKQYTCTPAAPTGSLQQNPPGPVQKSPKKGKPVKVGLS